jgi:hypothetical protein
VELAHDENRERGERFAVRLAGQLGRNGHLAEVELESAAHAAEGTNDRRHYDLVELDTGHRHRAIFQAFRVRVRRERGF